MDHAIDHASTIPGPAPSFGALPDNDVHVEVDSTELLEAERPRGEPPPLPSEATLPELEPLVIPRGKARLVLSGALLNLYRAIYQLENVAAAIARGYDESEGTKLALEEAFACADHVIARVEGVAMSVARSLDAGEKVRP